MPKIPYSLITLAALALISFFSVDIFYRVLTDHLERIDPQKIIAEQIPEVKKQARPVLSNYRIISDRALFGVPERLDQEDPKDIETLEPTQLNLALLGTVEGDGDTGWAVIMDNSKKKQDIYRIGDSVQEAVINKIVRNKVILRVGERNEVLTIEEGSKEAGPGDISRTPASNIAAALPSRTISLRRSDVEESLQDINKILSEARVRPYFKDGTPKGLIVTGIRGNSLFRRMGFRNGDIVQGVDSKPITSPDDIVSMYSDLKSASNVAIQILRRGREQTLNYNFR